MNGMDATESDKLHLVMVCADEIAPRSGIAPEELWGAGWLGIQIAHAKWSGAGPFLPLARRCITKMMVGEVRELYGRRKKMLTGGTPKNS